MARGKKYQPEQVVNLLRQIEVAVANGKSTEHACRDAFRLAAAPLPIETAGRRNRASTSREETSGSCGSGSCPKYTRPICCFGIFGSGRPLAPSRSEPGHCQARSVAFLSHVAQITLSLETERWITG